MNAITKTVLVAVLVALGLALSAWAAESPKTAAPSELDKLVGQPADLAPWAYAWRADRQVQEKPEAYFIPRRLAHLEKTYRKADTEPTIQIAPDKWVKLDGSFASQQSRREGPMIPPPKGVLHAGLLWETHVLWNRIELHWPKDKGPVPNPEAVEMRFHPKAAWFGVEWDRVAGKPEVSADGLTWTYSVKDAVVPDSMKAMGSVFRTFRCMTAGMVVVYVDPQGAPAGGRYAVPEIRVVGLKDWKRMDLEIEWGFQAGTEKSDYSGRIEGYVGIAGNVAPLAGDAQTRVTESGSWTSASASGGRRGIKCSVLYLPWGMNDIQKAPGGEHQTTVTVWTKGGNFTFLPEDLEAGPILAPEYGFYVTKASGGKAAREFATELAAKGLKGIRQRTREHREATTEEAIREVTMTKAPAGVTELPPMKEVEEPAMQVRTPEEWWNKAWRKGVYQLKNGPYSYWFAREAACPIQAMDLVGLHELAAGQNKLASWLNVPGIKVESDCLDGDGNFHGFGARWDWTTGGGGTTGFFLSIMGAHYFLSGDKEWFQKHQARLQKAADYIIRQRTEYMKEVPNRGQLRSAGLQPPTSAGENWGRNDWRFFYCNDRASCDGLLSFGRALSDFDPQKGKAYVEEARRYQEDIRKSVAQTIALTPVQKVLDGTYRSYSPGCCYFRRSFNAWGWDGHGYGFEDQMHLTGLQGAPTLGSLHDPRHEGHWEVFQDRFMLAGYSMKGLERGFFAARAKKGLSAEENWFWGGISGQPGNTWLSDEELYRDDVSNFLRLLVDTYWHATHPGDGEYYLAEGGLVQNWKPGSGWDKNTNSMGWFIRNFRNLLVMEDVDEEPWRLWLGRATPRHWLEQGKKISVKNAPTYFGTVAYEIVSDVDNGRINATVELPSRKAPQEVVLRFRHPKAAPIKAVTVNGKPWTEFNKDKETITLKGLTGTVAVTARY